MRSFIRLTDFNISDFFVGYAFKNTASDIDLLFVTLIFLLRLCWRYYYESTSILL